MHNNREIVKNGFCYTRTGNRRLEFDRNLNLTPVVYGVYSGYQPSRGTYQVEGFIHLSYEWGHGDAGTLYMNDGEISRENEIYKLIIERYPFVDEFLQEHGRGSSWIPEEVIPKSEYLANKAKKKKILTFLNRTGLSKFYDVNTFMRCSKRDLSLEPIPLDFDPNTYIPYSKDASGALVNIHHGERWFGIPNHGYAEEIDINSSNESIDHMGGTTYSHKDGSPLGDISRYIYVIRVEHEPHTCMDGGHYSYGMSIKIWEVDKKTDKTQEDVIT